MDKKEIFAFCLTLSLLGVVIVILRLQMMYRYAVTGAVEETVSMTYLFVILAAVSFIGYLWLDQRPKLRKKSNPRFPTRFPTFKERGNYERPIHYFQYVTVGEKRKAVLNLRYMCNRAVEPDTERITAKMRNVTCKNCQRVILEERCQG